MSQRIAWILRIVSVLLDVAWAISVKYADGYTRLGWSLPRGYSMAQPH